MMRLRPHCLAAAASAVSLASYCPPVTLPAGTVCTPYAATFATPTGVPSPPAPTITTLGGLPPTLAWAVGTGGLDITGTPAWDEFGDWAVSANGTVPAASWYQPSSWSGSGTLTIAAPSMAVAPGAFDIPGYAQMSNEVILTVTPPCVYTVTGIFIPPLIPGNALTLVPTSPFDTDPTGSVGLKISAAGDRTGTTQLELTITSAVPGTPPVTLPPITVTKH